MIKLFRRLELGRNLDIEVHAALNRGRGRRRRPALRLGRGRLDQRRRHLSTPTSAMVVEKLAEAEDGWGLALDRLRAAGRASPTTPQALGRALAETHAALREAFPTAEVLGAARRR